MASAIRNDSAIAVVLASVGFKNGKRIGSWLLMDYSNSTLTEGEEWADSEVDAIENAKVRIEAIAQSCKKAAEAEQYRLAVLAEKRNQFDQLIKQIADRNRIISENRGWFGAQAKARKAAKAQLATLQEQLSREFPNGRP